MWSIDVAVFGGVMLFTSVLGIWKGKLNQSSKATSGELLVGSNVSTLSVALSVCSSFLSAVSLLGFPSEVYFRGTMIIWFIPMYFISFPIVAYIFLPPIYELKLTSLYEYLERRFTFANRLIASIIFLIQTLLYSAVALYAPALAISDSFSIPLFVSIILTASLSAIYLLLGGAAAGIWTSALQMLLILGSLFAIICASLMTWTPSEIFEKNYEGGRLIFFDFRIDPTIRHSFFPLFFGGAVTIFSLFAANQLTLQRYMSLPTIKKAQTTVLLNAPMNTFVLLMYVFVGLIIFNAFECHPALKSKDQIFSAFVKDVLFVIPGLEGIFLAAVYSAGLSTLTASYSALTAVVIEDIIKTVIRKKTNDKECLSDEAAYKLVQIFPFIFATLAVFMALAIQFLDTMILQISFSIFGAAGGASLGIFVVGLFCPWITSKRAAISGQLAAIVSTILIVSGSVYYHVRAIDLPFYKCNEEYYDSNSTYMPFNYSSPNFGTVVADNSDSILSQISQISYHYYGLIGVIVCLLVSNFIQLLVNKLGSEESSKDNKPLDIRLIAEWARRFIKTTGLPNSSDIPLLHPEIKKLTGYDDYHVHSN
uniref:Sodium-dependent multivitamin transporter n=1 Tax=Panagrolaimus sp. PS1159 TaxID=55785 RepID=A0AC35FBJ4_9BILA